MSKIVVTAHKHHPEEGVYRVVFAREIEHVRHIDEENPKFDPEREVSEKNRPRRRRTETFVTHADHEDIVWADDDPKWKGKTDREIAQAQRRAVSRQLAKRQKAAEAAERERQAKSRDLGGAGTEL